MRARKWVAVAALLFAAVLLLTQVPDLYAQANQAPQSWTVRSNILAGLRNVGIEGAFFNSGAGGSQYLMYPAQGSMGAGYGANLLSGLGSFNNTAYRNAIRAGHGVWTLTQDGEVVYTGIRIGMQDAKITAMQYDADSDPNLSKLGKGGSVAKGENPHIQWVPKSKLGLGVAFTGADPGPGLRRTSLGSNYWPDGDLIEEGKEQQALSKPPVSIINLNLSDYSSFDEWPEQIIVTKWTTSQGLTFTEKVSTWTHPDFDDFYLDEYIIENTGDTDGIDGPNGAPTAKNDLYIGLQDKFSNVAAGGQWWSRYWRDEREWYQDDVYYWDAANKLLYNHDEDHPLYWVDHDDKGDPYKDALAAGTLTNGGKIRQTENQMLSPAHIGMGVVAYTDDPTSPYKFNAHDMGQGYVTPDGDQPYAVRFWQVFSAELQEDPNNLTMTEAQIYSEVLGPGRQIDADVTDPSGQISLVLFGPYDLPANGKIKLVVMYGAGHPGQMLGNTDAYVWARTDKDLSTKQQELHKGYDALVQNLESARFAYANAYDIPDSPPDVNFRTGSSATATMQCEWSTSIENAVNPDQGVADIAGYRVYRTSWFEMGPWSLVADIPKGTQTETNAYKVEISSEEGGKYIFTDKNSAAGFSYHYSVRAYADGHTTWSPGGDATLHPLGMADLPGHVASHLQIGLEGGFASGTQRTYAAESPFATPNADTEALNSQVLVVPNPYLLDESHAYPGSTKLRFVGIPSHCRIRVYSVSGELVSDFVHNDSQKGETLYDQFTWTFNGEIATGVYFWVVESLIEGGSKGKLQRGTLMVIR